MNPLKRDSRDMPGLGFKFHLTWYLLRTGRIALLVIGITYISPDTRARSQLM